MKLKVVTSLLLLAVGVTTVTANAHAQKRLYASKNSIKTYEEEHKFAYDHSTWQEHNLIFSEKERIERDEHMQQLDEQQRPVYGILTEPLRGNIVKSENEENSYSDSSYVPRAHVQFLEQTGIKVVPIDYRLPIEELYAKFDQVNGLYIPGDSHMTVLEEAYKFTFMATLDYCRIQDEASVTFPVFMMGNSLQTYVRARGMNARTLASMQQLQFQNLQLKMIDGLHPGSTYLFDKMSREEQQAVFNAGKFLNSQNSGLRVRELNLDTVLSQNIEAIAVFRNFNEDGSQSDDLESHFIAIAEDKKLPIYFITYDIEAVQFQFEDPSANLDKHILDHSIITRAHAQYIAKQIGDEGRMNNRSFTTDVYPELIRHQKLVNVAYSTKTGHKANENIPKGLNSRDVYLIN